MSKRRRGFPSETHVKRGDRFVHGDKEFIREARPEGPPARAVPGNAFKNCCLKLGRFDGSRRNYYRRD
jgi:hypothetical protein